MKEEIKQQINKLLPCIQEGCSQDGIIPEQDGQGDWQPAQCEFCYKIRFPFLEELEKLFKQQHQKDIEKIEKLYPEKKTSAYWHTRGDVKPEDIYKEAIKDIRQLIKQRKK